MLSIKSLTAATVLCMAGAVHAAALAQTDIYQTPLGKPSEPVSFHVDLQSANSTYKADVLTVPNVTGMVSHTTSHVVPSCETKVDGKDFSSDEREITNGIALEITPIKVHSDGVEVDIVAVASQADDGPYKNIGNCAVYFGKDNSSEFRQKAFLKWGEVKKFNSIEVDGLTTSVQIQASKQKQDSVDAS